MASLDEFLSGIGVGSLSTVIELPATPDADAPTPGPAAKLHERILEEVTKTDDRTLALLKDQWSDFSEQIQTGDTLMKQLQSEEEELKALEDEMDGPDAFLPPLLSHLETQQSLAAAHLLTTTSVVLVSALLAFHSTVAALSEATTAGDLPKAVQELRSVSRAVEVGAEEWIEQTDLWKALIRWAADEEARLEGALQTAVEACFEIEVPTKDNGQTAQLVFRERVPAAPNGPELEVRTLLQGLEDLAAITGRKDQSDTILVRFAKQILRHFIAPFLEANGPRPGDTAFAKSRCEFVLDPTAPDTGISRMTLRPSSSSGDDAIEGLSKFLAFLADKSSLFPLSIDEVPSKQAAMLTAHLTPSLQSHVISSHLMPSLPASVTALDAYTSVLAKATAFEADFLPSHGLFAFLPASLRRDGHEVEEQRVIRSWAARVPHHWARHVGDSALARVRNSVKSWDWGAGEVVDVEVREEEEMLGLLLGLGLVDPEDEAAVAAAAAGDRSQLDALERSSEPSFDGKRRLPRELALQTVPKSAKREMTMEEALRPRVCRPRPPTPPERSLPLAQPEDAESEASKAAAIPGAPAKRNKLGATKISAPTYAESTVAPNELSPVDSDARERTASLGTPAVDGEPSAPEQADTAFPPASRVGSSSPHPATVQAESAAPTIAPHQIDEAAVVVPAASAGDSYAPFETPALTAAGIETTADAAPAEDVVRPHEYRAAVHDDVDAEEETSRQHTPLTEENLGQPRLDTALDATCEASTLESAMTEARTSDTFADAALETGSREAASPALSDPVKEESVEPELPDVEDDALGTTEEHAAFPAATATYALEQSVPISAADARLLEDGAGDSHPSTHEADGPSQLRSLFPEDQVNSPFAAYGSGSPITVEAGWSQGESSAQDATAPSQQSEAATVDSSSTVTASEADAAYFPIDDDPYADDSFAEDSYAYEPYPAPTHDDFFSPPAESPPPVSAFPPPVQPSSASSDPYAPPAVLSNSAEGSSCRTQPEQDAYMPLAATATVSPSAGSAVAPQPLFGSGMASAPPPPPRANASANSDVTRTKPPKRRTLGYPALALDQPACPPSSANVVDPDRAAPDRYPSSQQSEAYPTAGLPARSLPQRSSTDSPKPNIAPLRSGFTTSNRSNRSGTPDRHNGLITNHIQQRFVSPPPTMLNPYVPMALPPSVAASPSSSYLPANDPLLAGLLGGGTSRTGSVFPFAGKSTAPSASKYTGAAPVEQVRMYGAQGAQSFVPAFEPETQHYTPPYVHHAQYGAQAHSQPAMRMRGGCSLEQMTMAPALRLRGGADLGDMDDDGNHSADDWGFGDDEIAPAADDMEDAWGFEAAPDETETPAPPIQTSPTSPPRSAPSHGSHAPRELKKPLAHAAHASTSSTNSQPPSMATSRPSSLIFSPSHVLPARSSLEIVDFDEGAVEGGDDAWGFDEEDAIDQIDQAQDTSPHTVAVSNADSTTASVEAAAEQVYPSAPSISRDADPGDAIAKRIVTPATSADAVSTQSHDGGPMTNGSDDAGDEWGFGEDRGNLALSLSGISDGSEPSAPSTTIASTSRTPATEASASEASETLGAVEDVGAVEAKTVPQALSEPEPLIGSPDNDEGDDDAWELEPPRADSPVASVLDEWEPDRPQANEGMGLQPRKAESIEMPLAPSGTHAGGHEAEPPAPADDPATSNSHGTDRMDDLATQAAAAEHAAPLPTEPATALTAPATDLEDATFPDARHQILPSGNAGPPSLTPTPPLPRPLPHSDDFAPGALQSPGHAHLLDYAAAQLEDAQLIDDGPQAAQSPALDADEANGHAELTDVENFAGDRRAAQQDMSVVDALIEDDSQAGAGVPPDTTDGVPVESFSADFDDFADFAEDQAEQQPRTVAWEPFEEPSGEPESTPASAEGYDRRNAFERDGFSAEPSELPESLSSTETPVEHFADLPLEVGSANRATTTVASGVLRPFDDESQSEATPSQLAHSSAATSGRAGQTTTTVRDAKPDPAEATAAGAEILEVHDENTAPGSTDDEESVVQHEDLRPWPRDDSAVQHESLRPVVTEAVAPGILLPAQEAHPQQRTFSPPPLSLPMELYEAAEWDFDDDAVGSEVLADTEVVLEAADDPIREGQAEQHIPDRPLLVGDSEQTREGTVSAAATVEPQGHTFSPSAPALALAEHVDEKEAVTDSQALAVEDVPAEAASSFADEQQQQQVTSAVVAPAEEPAQAAAELTPEENEHDLAAEPSPGPAKGEHPHDDDSRETTTITAEAPPPPPTDNAADVDDPWDLDPMEPDDATAEVTADDPTALQADAVTEKPAADSESGPIVESTSTEADGFDLSQKVGKPSIPSDADDVKIAPQLLTSRSPDAVRAVSPPSSIPEPLSPRPTAKTPGATLDSWQWDDEEASPPSEPPEPRGSAKPEAEDPAPDAPSILTERQLPTVRREKMMVSRQSREIVAMAEEILSTAFQIASPSFVLPQFGPASAPLLRHFVSILSLYRATASVHNSNLLASVPAIAMQFANDAEWIGREANRLWDAAVAQHADQVSQDQRRDVELAIQSMRQLGRDTRQRQISIQQAALMESLDEAGGFLRTSDETRFSACERALQQVTHILQRLALVWKPIMTPTALYTALGGLVNEVLLRVLDEIEEQTDISEEESNRLNRLSKMLHELEGLFDGSETNVGREVPIWYKFSFLSELLEASMADFMFLFDNRFLLDFTPQELVRLLRALFADSPQRDAAVKRILQGHPEAPADAEEEA